MLPSDAPFLETALALLALPFRPVTAGCLFHFLCGNYTASVSCQTHVDTHGLTPVALNQNRALIEFDLYLLVLDVRRTF
jgi:hypothetical protein